MARPIRRRYAGRLAAAVCDERDLRRTNAAVAAVTAFSLDGEVGVVPSDGWVHLLVFRKDLFQAAGVKVPTNLDARSLVSVWGHQSSGLADYSGRRWAGLVRDYYLPRWELWGGWPAEAARAGREADVGLLRARVVAHEASWQGSTGDYSTVAEGRTLDVAARILDRLGY